MFRQPSIIFLFLIFFSCSSDSSSPNEMVEIDLPSVNTDAARNITTNSAEVDGTITSDGGGQVTARGFVWDTGSGPMLDDSKTTNGTGEGTFNVTMSDLEENTKYFVRAYATNAEGTTYGNEITFTTLKNTPKTFNGDVYLGSQEDVESFGSQGYSEITGILTIGSNVFCCSNISDLNFLSDLESIGSDLLIRYNDVLKNIDGLNGLVGIGGRLIIRNNSDLENIQGLSNLVFLGGGIYLRDNNSLASISGISSFQEINGDLEIHRNDNLKNLDALENLRVIKGILQLWGGQIEDISGLNNLETIGGDFWITQMDKLNEIIGFDNLISIEGTLYISSNTNLEKVQGFSNLSYLGGVYLDGGGTLSELIGFESLNSIEGDFYDSGYPNLVDLQAFENLSEVIGNLRFRRTSYTNVDFLSNLVHVGGNLEFHENYGLPTIILENLQTVMGSLTISGGSNEFNLDSSWGLTHIGEGLIINDANSSNIVNGIPGAIGLTNLKAFENLIEVNGDVVISKNENLEDFCDLQPLLSNGFSGTINIFENAYNPTKQDVIDGDCNFIP
ncbi:leucine-rich repeat protein [Flagellimonas hymeniacidonis]|uniref:Leucine-rich repeat protein n=1 Tax=Flagellimonas hymeniacidonis TaxID=2603628 RepID=A0A5C8V0R4_9FLAO|nr:leucine-rich repeat protein [Flagellimonas hymeniacidonis]TXN35074.1 leucine-rich repeat protein [Flagellimonas hymeniacidonis]